MGLKAQIYFKRFLYIFLGLYFNILWSQAKPKLEDYVFTNVVTIHKLEDIQDLEINQPTVLRITGKNRSDKLVAQIKKWQPEIHVVKPNARWTPLTSFFKIKKSVLLIFDDEVAVTNCEKFRNSFLNHKRFSVQPKGKWVVFESEALDSVNLYHDAIELWQYTGRAPNIIKAPKIKEQTILNVVSQLNQLRRFRGNIDSDLIDEVYWEAKPGVITTSQFSFPLVEESQILKPYLNGFRLSPGEMIHHEAMSDQPRSFDLNDIALDNKLIYDFDFNGKILNKSEEKWDRSIEKNIVLAKDAERGEVLKLTTDNAFIDYTKSNQLDFSKPIAIAVWLRPDKINRYMGIVGFGSTFSLKLFQGKPDFTTVEIKDHVLNYVFEVDKWNHLVVVFNPGATVNFYVNGQPKAVLPTSAMEASDHSLLIGNNIWGEQFYGSIDDLKIWNRGLSDTEVKQLYHQKDHKNITLYPYILMAMALIFGLFLWRRQKKIKLSKKIQPVESKEVTESMDEVMREVMKEVMKEANQIKLFGGLDFQLISGKPSPKFSPLLKQLFTYLLLNSIPGKKGVSSEQLTATFWSDFTKSKAKENRGANIRKLRLLLQEVEGVEVLFENNKWTISLNENSKVDIFEFYVLKAKFKAGNFGEAEINRLFQILKRGPIVPHIQELWIDVYKRELVQQVEELLFFVFENYESQLSSDQLITILELVLKFDSLNEEAFKILVNLFVKTGKHGQAQRLYDDFTKDYAKLYGEKYLYDFQSLVN